MWDRKESSGNVQMDRSGDGEGPSSPVGSVWALSPRELEDRGQGLAMAEEQAREPFLALYPENQLWQQQRTRALVKRGFGVLFLPARDYIRLTKLVSDLALEERGDAEWTFPYPWDGSSQWELHELCICVK